MNFNRGYIDFFNQLSHNNNKDWFRENKKWYELVVRGPFKDLIDKLLPEVKKIDEGIQMSAKDALFRINRDLRFSENQLPYKTHMAAGFSRGGRKSQFAGFYLQIGKDHIILGGGLPYIEKEILRKIRIEIGYNKQEFDEIINEPRFKSLFGFVHGENDREPPKSFSGISEEYPLIANKQFYYGAVYRTESWLFSQELPAHIINHFQVGAKFNHFLIRAISDFSSPAFPDKMRKVLEF